MSGPAAGILATSPAIWKKMWEIIPDDNFGLNLDPSHLVWQMIDHERVVRDFSSKIFHVHAKDLMIDREGLYLEGYDNVVSVEHEDRNFEGSEEKVKRGFLIARDALRPYIR